MPVWGLSPQGMGGISLKGPDQDVARPVSLLTVVLQDACLEQQVEVSPGGFLLIWKCSSRSSTRNRRPPVWTRKSLRVSGVSLRPLAGRSRRDKAWLKAAASTAASGAGGRGAGGAASRGRGSPLQAAVWQAK